MICKIIERGWSYFFVDLCHLKRLKRQDFPSKNLILTSKIRWEKNSNSAESITDDGRGDEKSTPSANTCSKLERLLLLTACSRSLSRSLALTQVLLAYFFSTYFARMNSHLSSLKQEKQIGPFAFNNVF